MSNNYQDQFKKIWKVLEKISENTRAQVEEHKEFANEHKEFANESRKYVEERRKFAKERRKYAKERRKFANESRKYVEERRKYAKEREQYDKESQERMRILNEESQERMRILNEELDQLRKQSEKARREAEEASKKTEEQIGITEKAVAETQQFMKELGKQFGYFGNNMGALVEGVSAPSIKRILKDHFEVVEFFPQRKRTVNGESYEIELIGIAEDYLQRVYTVEIKTQFGGRGYHQVLENLGRFVRFYPEFEYLELYGMIAAPRMTEQDLRWASQHGIYPLTIADDFYTLQVPEDFEAKNYGNDSASSPPFYYRDLPGKWIEFH